MIMQLGFLHEVPYYNDEIIHQLLIQSITQYIPYEYNRPIFVASINVFLCQLDHHLPIALIQGFRNQYVPFSSSSIAWGVPLILVIWCHILNFGARSCRHFREFQSPGKGCHCYHRLLSIRVVWLKTSTFIFNLFFQLLFLLNQLKLFQKKPSKSQQAFGFTCFHY